MALAANTKLPEKIDNTLEEPIVKTSAVIYQNALVMINAAGTAVPCADSTTGKFIGIAVEGSAYPVTGDGTLTVKIQKHGEFQVPLVTSVTVGLVGTAMYAFDDATVTNVTTKGPQVGILTQFTSTNLGWVELRKNAMLKGA